MCGYAELAMHSAQQESRFSSDPDSSSTNQKPNQNPTNEMENHGIMEHVPWLSLAASFL
jgi:hypothetical protein